MAAPTQRIIWTALPDRTDLEAGTLRVNVLVTPRLSLPAGTAVADLSRFQVWQQWPRFAAAARYQLTLGGYTDVLQPAWVAGEAQAAEDVWRALFPIDTPVRTRAFEDFTGKAVLSYPMADLDAGIRRLYLDVAVASPDQLPVAADLRERVQKVLGHPKRYLGEPARDPQGQAFRQVAARLADASPRARFDPAEALGMLRTYHRPLQAHDPAQDHRIARQWDKDPHELGAHWPNYKPMEMPDPESFAKETEFHQVVSSLGQHSYLMRRCALVIPFELPLDALPNGNHDLYVKVDWPVADEDVVSEPDAFAITQVRIHDRRCTVRARGTELVDGWVDVGGRSQFDLLQLDVDGAGLKLSNLSTTLEEGQDERLVEDDDEFPVPGHHREDKRALRPVEPVRQGLPTLRSAGLQLARRHRARAIRGLFDDSKRLEDALASNAEIRLSAEDVVRGYRADVFDEHAGKWQSLMRFDGRYTLLHDGSVLGSKDEEGVLRLGATESPDGSVPGVLKASELLFAWNGWSLAAPEPGRGVGTDDTVQPGDAEVPPGMPLEAEASAHPRSLPSLRFGRSYRVRLRWADLAGGGEPYSADAVPPAHAVTAPVRYLRHEAIETPPLALVAEDVVAPAAPQWDGESMQRAALRTLNETPDLNTVKIDGRARRHLVPGRVGHRFAEHHGMLDKAGRIDPALYATLRDQDRAIDTHVVDTPGGKFTYAVAPEGFALPYLPDPLALGVALRVTGVPGIDPGEVHRIPFYGDKWDPAMEAKGWPHALPFSIVAFEGKGKAKWKPATREFLVPLPKAERARVHLSALLTEAGLDQMHLAWQLRTDERHWKKLKHLILDGAHWMFTPSRVLELVHAVQKPLVVPTPPAIQARRGPGQATATLTLAPPVHSKSSVRLDVRGRWAEPLDDPSRPEPLQVSEHSAPAFERRLARLEAPDGAAYQFTGEHAFADTRYRRVSYRVSATSRFREFMDESIRTSPEGERLKVTSPEVTCWVKSSAPPPPPRVLYAIPTFGWTRQSDRSTRRSWRNGGGLRVYLDRPWFATGFNEMLAVVLAADTANPAPETGTRKAPVTQWGADPIWVEANRGKLSTFSPTLQDFPLAVKTSPLPDMGIPGYPADERAIPAGTGGALDLSPRRPPGNPGPSPFAPHAVGFDPERQLWYADIVIRPQSAYFPFVRLALARYQPMSEENAHLSQVVLTDFQQLTPDRLAIVTDASRAGVTVKRVAVHGMAPAQGGSGDRAFGGQVELQVQRLPAGADPDLGWITMAAIPVPAVRPLPGGGRLPLPARTGTTTRRPTTALERTQSQQAIEWMQAGRYTDLLKNADVLQWLLPPLIDQQEIAIPPKPKPDDQLRLLVTESERFPGEQGEKERSRIVYAETIAL